MCNLCSHKYLLFLLVTSYFLNITVNIFLHNFSLHNFRKETGQWKGTGNSCSRGRLIYVYFCTSKTFSINVFLRNLCSAKYLCLELCAYFMRTFFCTSKTFSVNMFLRNLCSAKYLCLELCAYFMHTFCCTSKTFSVNVFLHNLSNICPWNYHWKLSVFSQSITDHLIDVFT